MKNEKSVVTIGTFDGVHKGHGFLIKKTVQAAKKSGAKSVVVALEKPVKNVKGLLTVFEEKIRHISSFGPDEIVALSVPSEILSWPPEKFFDDFLIKNLKAREIVCGHDFAFGKNRKGGIRWLKNKAKKSGVKASVIKALKAASKEVSSSQIRDLLEKGDIAKANKLLGRAYSFSGFPFREAGIGKKLGFPTVNLEVEKGTLSRTSSLGTLSLGALSPCGKMLPKGVFASLISDGKKTYPSVASIGNRPTFSRGKKIIPEVHILDFKGKWGNKKTEVALLKKIRDEKKFRNSQELRKNIEKDVCKAKKYFGL